MQFCTILQKNKIKHNKKNAAAGVVVAKSGTASLTLSELERALGEDLEAQHGSVAPLEIARFIVERWRDDGLEVGFTNGCFDILHPGHVSLLEQSAKACDRLIVGLNSDASVRRLKGPSRPVVDEAARGRMLAALATVDLVVIFEEDTPFELISALLPDVLVKGSDYAEADIIGADVVKANGGRVVRATLVGLAVEAPAHHDQRHLDRHGEHAARPGGGKRRAPPEGANGSHQADAAVSQGRLRALQHGGATSTWWGTGGEGSAWRAAPA